MTRNMPLLHKGDIIGENGRYIVGRRLGEGQFAEVWEVKQNSSGSYGHELRFALKLEKQKDRKTVKQEYKALKKLGNTCSQVVAVESCGMHDGRFYMVMQLLGESLYEARKQAVGGRLDVPTVKAVGLSTLTAIEQVHQQQMIHRDIKPANFVINPPNAAASKGSWLLIDFGLARRYTDDNGHHMQQRRDASFRGSTTYASVHAHKDEDLSRRDDLWSWLYMLAELLDGGLPWRHDKDAGEQHGQVDKQRVQQLKELCIQDPTKLTRSVPLPEPLAAISRHLASLGFADTPNYSHIRHCLQQLPDHQPQLRSLTSLVQHPMVNGQQRWDAAVVQQQDQEQGWADAAPWQQQQEQPQHAGDAAVSQIRQQQQHYILTPESPSEIPVASTDDAAAAGANGKRAMDAADVEHNQAKRRRADCGHSQLSRNTQQEKQQQQQEQEQQQQHRNSSAPLQCPTKESDDSRPSSGQGSAGSRMPSRPVEPTAQQQRHASQSNRSRSRDGQQDRDRQGETNSDAAHARQANTSRDSGLKRQARNAGHAGVALDQLAASAARAAKQRQAASAGNATEGSATEIEDLIGLVQGAADTTTKVAVQQGEQMMTSLAAVESIAVVGLTVGRIAQQAHPDHVEAVSQLLLDLAAFVSRQAAQLRSTKS